MGRLAAAACRAGGARLPSSSRRSSSRAFARDAAATGTAARGRGARGSTTAHATRRGQPTATWVAASRRRATTRPGGASVRASTSFGSTAAIARNPAAPGGPARGRRLARHGQQHGHEPRHTGKPSVFHPRLLSRPAQLWPKIGRAFTAQAAMLRSTPPVRSTAAASVRSSVPGTTSAERSRHAASRAPRARVVRQTDPTVALAFARVRRKSRAVQGNAARHGRDRNIDLEQRWFAHDDAAAKRGVPVGGQNRRASSGGRAQPAHDVRRATRRRRASHVGPTRSRA
jgi:hypothetical protein